MSPLLASSLLVGWLGATLLLSHVRWFARRPLTERLGPYVPRSTGRRTSRDVLSIGSFAEILGPVAQVVGGRASRLLGVSDDLPTRLAQVHAPATPAEFRLRQLAWTVGGLAGGTVVATVVAPVPLLTTLLVLGTPALAFLLVEERLSAAVTGRKRQLLLELPVVAEQIGMLLSAGYSLGGAVHRVAARGGGATGDDLRRVVARMSRGATEVDALQEWNDVAGLEVIGRLVAVLSLNREAGDLGRLVSEEARSIRREVQRGLVEQIERRNQQVWIPVTVAALVPGAVLIAIPFLEALRAFGAA